MRHEVYPEVSKISQKEGRGGVHVIGGRCFVAQDSNLPLEFVAVAGVAIEAARAFKS